MPLPPFDESGNMPVGIHRATLNEAAARFGSDSPQRARVTKVLKAIFRQARSTGSLTRCIVFGSYVTAKSAPRDVDILLVMDDTFEMEAQSAKVRRLFNHHATEHYVGASLFWIRPKAMFMSVDEYLAFFQRTREETLRGIMEVTE